MAILLHKFPEDVRENMLWKDFIEVQGFVIAENRDEAERARAAQRKGSRGTRRVPRTMGDA
jgi:hypothetical protein